MIIEIEVFSEKLRRAENLRVVRYQDDKASVSPHGVTQLSDDLRQYEKWRPYLRDLGAVESSTERVEVVNF